MSAESHPCKALNCPGICCRDITMYIPAVERRRVFPDAVPVIIDDLEFDTETPLVCAYAGYMGTIMMEYLKLNGWCQHLSDEGSCTVHDLRTSACRNFAVGCDECEDIRWEQGY